MNSRRARSSCDEAQAHAVERARELAELVGAGSTTGSSNVPGDPLGGELQPPDPAREQVRGAVPDDQCEQQRQQAGLEQAPLHGVHVRERVVQRRREQQDVPERRDRHRDLGERSSVPRDGARARSNVSRRLLRDRIVLDVARM